MCAFFLGRGQWWALPHPGAEVGGWGGLGGFHLGTGLLGMSQETVLDSITLLRDP